MYCTKCGSFLPDGTENCPNCNEPVNASTDNVYSNQQTADGVYYTPQSNTESESAGQQSYYDPSHSKSYYQPDSQQSYYQANQPNQIELEMKNNLSTANTLGILSILLGILFTPIAGIICGIIGLSKANNVPDMTMNPLIDKEKAKVKKLNILGIVIPIILWVVAFIVMFIAIMVFGFAASSVAYF